MRIREEFDSGHDNFLMLYRFRSGKRENVSSSSKWVPLSRIQPSVDEV